MPLDPVSLAAILQQLQQQGGGGAVQNAGNIPPARVAPQPPQQGSLVSSPAATPPMFPNQGQDQTVNPLMQMAQKAMSNPQAQTVPQPPTAPSTSSAHPILAKILSALGPALQNYGFGMQTGPQQLERLQMNQQKSEALANLAATQAWREQTAGIQQQRANTAEEQARTAGRRADTAEERVKAYQQLGEQRNQIQASKSAWQKDVAEGRLDQGFERMAQQAKLFEEGLKQKKELFEQDLGFKQEALSINSGLKESAQDIMRAAMQQGGVAKVAEIQQKATAMGLEHYFQDFMGNVPNPQQSVQGALQSGMPGLPAPSAQPPTTGAPTPARPTPQAKVKAKGGTPKSAQSNDPLGIR